MNSLFDVQLSSLRRSDLWCREEEESRATWTASVAKQALELLADVLRSLV